MTKVGDFQANVGKIDASIGLIMSYIFGTIFVIIGIVMIVNGIKGTKDPEDDINDKKTNIPLIVGGIFFILLAVGGVLWSIWWKKTTSTNRTAAQIGGTMAEINFAKNVLKS